MIDLLTQNDRLIEQVSTIINSSIEELTHEWVTSGVRIGVFASACDQKQLSRQASAFITALHDALHRSGEDSTSVPLAATPSLQQAYSYVYHIQPLLLLMGIIATRLPVNLPVTSAGDLLLLLQQAIARIPPIPSADTLYQQRLGHLNDFSWKLNAQRERDAIIQMTLQTATALVGAASSALWLWDTEKEGPVMLASIPVQSMKVEMAQSLLCFFRQTYKSCSIVSIDAHETDTNWPEAMQHVALVFIPISTPDGCQDILTVHHVPGGVFSHDDILLLTAIGNLTAIALHNNQLDKSERNLVSLLQSSIRQVVKATAGSSGSHAEFIQALLQVAEELIQAGAVCSLVHLRDQDEELLASISIAPDHEDKEQMLAVNRSIWETLSHGTVAATGAIQDIAVADIESQYCGYYAYARVMIRGNIEGIVTAFDDEPFDEEKIAFLHTITEQIGVGIDNRQQSTDLQRLLFELSNVNYISETITSTFDAHRIFSTVSQAASQAVNAPIAFCGWLEEDGAIRVIPDTTVGLKPEIANNLSLTYNNAVIRSVLDRQTDMTSLVYGSRAATAFPRLKALHVVDWVCVPMMVKPRARGIMLVADTKPRQFSRHEIALLSTYANQGALGMENSLLYEQVDHQLQQMEQLYQMTRSISSTLEFDVILQKLLAAATTALNLPVAFVCQVEDGSGIQQVAAALGIDSPQLLSARIDPSEGILGVVSQRGESIISSNLARDGRSTLLRDLAREEHLVSSLSVALQIHGRVVGTLTVAAKKTRTFTPANEQLLHAMAMEAAVAMQNARLYEQERERAKELRILINEVSQRMTISLEVINGLLEISRETEACEVSLTRTLLRLESIVAVQAGISDEDPGVVDVKEAMLWLASRKTMEESSEGKKRVISVIGAHLVLPSHAATALAIFIHEWLQAILEATRADTSVVISIGFQQLGREVLVHIEDGSLWEGRQVLVNHAIIAMVTRILPGAIAETNEAGIHRIRFRFIRPA